jgi:CO/xanthine dehydrogenase FAD-binding subunit
MQRFAYERPSSLTDAIGLLVAEGDAARPLSGGTDLIIQLRDRSLTPRVVVDVKGVPELAPGIRRSGDRLVIGANTVMTDIAADETIRTRFTALAEAAIVVGSVQIRNRASLAGNICNASPAADTAPALLIYGAVVTVAGPDGRRRIPIDEWFVRSGVTTIRAGELVTAIELPLADGPIASTHVRRTRRRGHDLASVTLAVAVPKEGPVTLSYGSVGPRPWVLMDSSGILADPASSIEARATALARLFSSASPSPTSMRAGPEYRLAMLRVLGMRALETAHRRLAEAPA